MENAQSKLMNRWLVVFGAILIQLCLGAIYAWSVYTPALTAPTAEQLSAQGIVAAADQPAERMEEATGEETEEAIEEITTPVVTEETEETIEEEVEPGLYGFSTKESQWPFSIGLLTFAIVMVLAGNWQKKSGPKMVAMTGGVVLGLGYILAGLLGSSLASQIFFIGIIGGAGIGLAYVCPIAVGVKWFPDKKGLITGLAVAGFGFGALIWVKVAGAWGHLIESFGVQGTWIIFGIIYLIAVLIGSIWMVNPPDNYKPEGWTPPPPKEGAATGEDEFNQWHMLKTPQFYMIWFCFIAGALAGLMVIGVIKLFGIDALQVSGLSATEASAAAGTAMAIYYALANGIGRIVWGSVSDSLGRKMSIFLMCLIQGIAMITFLFMGKMVWGLYVWAAIIGFNFGGNFALYPAATADYFGNKNVGVNYGWMFTAYGVGGLLGPQIAGYFKDLAPETADIMVKYQSWQPAFIIGGVICLVAAVVILLTKKPKAVA
jgi:OFA family oxalate/formate antiporter-like MFS transporter